MIQGDCHEFREGLLVPGRDVVVDRSELESRGSVRVSRDSWFHHDDACPVGCVFATKIEAQRAIDDWTMITLRKNAARYPIWKLYEVFEKELGDESRKAPRGVVGLGDDQFVIFGNDASTTDTQYEREIELLRCRLNQRELAQELAYALSEDGEKWAMHVLRLNFEYEHECEDSADMPDVDESEVAFIGILDELLWTCWFEAGEAHSDASG